MTELTIEKGVPIPASPTKRKRTVTIPAADAEQAARFDADQEAEAGEHADVAALLFADLRCGVCGSPLEKESGRCRFINHRRVEPVIQSRRLEIGGGVE